jgi:cytochrome c oxidase assembly protein subunit 11
MTSPALKTAAPQRRHRMVALAIVSVVAGMAGLSFAAAPLYQMFCRVTGYGGTTQVATQGSATLGERSLTVRFDTNVGKGLPWSFEPEVPVIKARTGQTQTVFFRVTNHSDREWTATAVYNVAPDQSGLYFNKISCFCFNEQTLGPGESAEWPVVFYLDPALEKDEVMARVEGVTLSYTFFASRKQPTARADVGTNQPKL